VTPVPLRVLGIDPGSLRAGWAVVAGPAARPELIACGHIALPSAWPFEQRLAALHEALTRIVLDTAPTAAAVEAPFHGVSARAALQLAHARGVMIAVLGAAHLPVSEYAPSTIKKAVTGRGRAEKVQVAALVRSLLRRSDPVLRDDVSDAAAAALCHLFRSGGSERLAAAFARARPKATGTRVSIRRPTSTSERGEPA
jgi:crossover junction endodeoxyribonuclease RuvC